MSNRFRHPIYGVKPKVVVRPSRQVASGTNSYCFEPCAGIIDSFIALELAIYNIECALQQYYQPNRAVAEFIAKMSARCSVPPVIFVRLVWRETNVGVAFNINNAIHRLQIKDIYLRYGFDYLGDPLFKDVLGLTLI